MSTINDNFNCLIRRVSCCFIDRKNTKSFFHICMPIRVIELCLMIGFMIIIWDQRDDKKMGDGLFNIHSQFYGLDVIIAW